MLVHAHPYRNWSELIATTGECRAAIATFPDTDSPAWVGNTEMGMVFPVGHSVRPRPRLPLEQLQPAAGDLWKRTADRASDWVLNSGADVGFAGAFVTRPGSKSDLHIDHTNGDRGYVFILFLNEVDGGELELRDEETSVLISPTAGLLVLLPMHQTSWHGVKEVVAGDRFTLSGHLLSPTRHEPIASQFWVERDMPISKC
jgi:hypothetical protein